MVAFCMISAGQNGQSTGFVYVKEVEEKKVRIKVNKYITNNSEIIY